MTTFPDYQRLVINCDCHEITHQVVLEYDDQEPYELQIFPMLISERPWWQRLFAGLAFITGWKGKNHWHYTDIVANPEMVAEIKRFIEQFEADRADWLREEKEEGFEYKPRRGFTLPGARP